LRRKIFFTVITVFCILHFYDDLAHRFYYQRRMFAGSGFSTKHYSIGPFEYSIGNICDLTAVGLHAVNHAFHHLRSYYNGLGTVKTFTDNLTLRSRNFFYRQFNAEVTTGNHHRI